MCAITAMCDVRVSASKDESAQAIQWYRNTHSVRSLLAQPYHTCTERCHLVQVPHIPTHFVCTTSLTVHTHSERCIESTGEGDVCRFTGYVLIDRPILVKGIQRPSKDTYGRGPKHTNDHYSGPVTFKKKRTSFKSSELKHCDFVRCARNTLYTILSSPKRCELYNQHAHRLARAVRAKSRKQIKASGCFKYTECADIIREGRRNFASYLRIPVQVDEATMNRLATQIVTYYKTISAHGFPRITTTKKACVFTAMIAARMTVGFSIGNITVIQKHPLFADHGIAEVQYSKLGLKCNDMTNMYKILSRSCHNQGVVLHPYIVQFDGT